MAEIPAHALLALADDMHKAFQNWFQKRAKRPKFRGKFQRQFSIYMVNQRTAFEEGKAELPKLVFECQHPEYVIPKVARVGIDLGVKTLATAFDGGKIIAIDAPKALRETGKRMSEFLRQITYKADWRQREVTEVDRWYPSSRRCSACGEIHDMPLSKRWMSWACGNEMNQDENASRNLYAYPEERGNAGDILPKTRRERG